MTNNYQVMGSEYLNTGGHCMVHITDVYNKQSKTMQYVFINEEYLIVSTYDYIRNELPDGADCEDFMTHCIRTENLTHEPSFDNSEMNEIPEDIAELLFNCLLLFIREYCKYTKDNYICSLDALPNELYDQVSREYSHWLAENELDPVTDGYKIIVDERYLKAVESDTPNGQVAKDLQQHLTESIKRLSDDEEEREEFYREKLHIIYCGKLFTFDNGADVYNGLEDFAKWVIDQQ